MAKERTPLPWARFAVEMFVIVFSVLLALVLEDWRQDREERKVVAAVTASLRAELERNQRVLEAMLPLHETMLDTFRTRIAALSPGGAARDPSPAVTLDPLDRLGFPEALGSDATLATGAWEAARSSGALPRIGTDELFVLSAAYAAQERVDRALQRLTDRTETYVLAAIDGRESERALITLDRALREAVAREVRLCETYRTLVHRLTEVEPPPEPRCGSGTVTIR